MKMSSYHEKMTRYCEICGRELIYVQTKSGRYIPCDYDRVPVYEGPGGDREAVMPGGKPFRCSLTGEPLLESKAYVRHVCEVKNG